MCGLCVCILHVDVMKLRNNTCDTCCVSVYSLCCRTWHKLFNIF